MEPEVNSAAGSEQSSASSPAEASRMETGNEMKSPAPNRESLVSYADHPNFNFAIAITWLVALLSILATLYFWWLNKNVTDSIADKKTKKDAITEQIQSPSMVAAEKDALSFKSSVEVLSKANKERFVYAKFLPELNTKITNDTKITALSVSAAGALSLAGTTKSYRSIADLAMALKSWSTLSGVEINSAAINTDDGSGKMEAIFSITANIVSAAKTTAATPSNVTGGQQ